MRTLSIVPRDAKPLNVAPAKDVRWWNEQLARERDIQSIVRLLPDKAARAVRRAIDIKFPVGPAEGDLVAPAKYFRHRRRRAFSWLARRSYGLRFESPSEWARVAISIAQREIGRLLTPVEATLVCESVQRACRIRAADVTGDREAFAS